jgi:hemerythrin superfamily protein
MSYSFESKASSKWDTIQEDVADMYLEVIEEDETEDGDIFGFSKAIQVDHLSDEQIDELLNNIDWGN